MKKIQLVIALAASIGFTQCTQAILFRSSQMVGYNTGNLGVSGSGNLDGWENSTAQVTVTNGSGSLDGTSLGLVASAGDRVFITATNALNTRNLFVPANGTFPQSAETNVYYSFLYKFNNAVDVSTDGELIIRLNRANSGTGTAQHFDLLAKNVGGGGLIQIGISKAGAPNNTTNYAATNLSAGQTVFVVVRQHILVGAQNDIYDLWINPPAQYFGTNDVDVPPSDISIGALTTDGTEDTSNTGPGRFVVCAGAISQFDEFRVATTWAEVTPAFGSCVGAAIEISPTNVTQVAEIAATVRVQALSSATSPTYQWQLSTNGGTSWNGIAGATASTYTTPNLALSDSGNRYRAIVSVSCNNSSATSAPAVVTLIAPVPTPAGVIMNDTFTDPELGFDDRSNLPLTSTNSVWYTGLSPQSLVAFGQGGNMVGTTVAGTSSLWLGYFIETNLPVHLAVGNSIKVTLPFIPNSFGAHTNNGGLRMGLFDYFDGGTRVTADSAAAGGSAGNGSGVRGYMLNLDFGPTFSVNSPLGLLVRNSLGDNNLMGSVSLYESLGSGPSGGGYSNAPAFQPGTEYTLEFTVARTAVNSVDITTSILSGSLNLSHTVTETNYAYHRFDAFAIRPNSAETSADSFTFPEFRVVVLQGSVAVTPFSITSVQALAPDSIKLTWQSETGASYHILSSPSLSTHAWSTNATVLATASSTSYTNTPVAGSERYYQVVGLPYTP